MSRLEELLESLVKNTERIATKLDDVLFSIQNIRDELEYDDDFSMASQMISAIEAIAGSVDQVKSSIDDGKETVESVKESIAEVENAVDDVSHELGLVGATLSAIETNTSS